MRLHLLFLTLFVLFLAACTGGDQEACVDSGGVWGPVGLSTQEVCNMRTSDVGKFCESSKECEGACIADLSDSQKEKLENGEILEVEGQCTEFSIVVGCLAFVEEGKVDSILCLD